MLCSIRSVAVVRQYRVRQMRQNIVDVGAPAGSFYRPCATRSRSRRSSPRCPHVETSSSRWWRCHQLAVLGRSNRRVRPSDRLFWVCVRRWWPRWKDGLVLVHPATVARWRREGFRWLGHRARRRPGRPRIEPQLRSLIQRMALENGLWGAPRIHGELLKRIHLFQNARCRGICQTDGRDGPKPGGHFSRTTSATWRSRRRGRAALFRCHAGRTGPLRGPWLIGLPRINRRLWAAVSRRITFAAPAHVSHLARTRRGREPSKLLLAVLHPGLLSPKELRLDSSAAHTGILLRHRQGLDHSVSNSRERADSSLVRWS